MPHVALLLLACLLGALGGQVLILVYAGAAGWRGKTVVFTGGGVMGGPDAGATRTTGIKLVVSIVSCVLLVVVSLHLI